MVCILQKYTDIDKRKAYILLQYYFDTTTLLSEVNRFKCRVNIGHRQADAVYELLSCVRSPKKKQG